MTIPELQVNTRRLRDDVDALARIGRREDHGIYRMSFSPGDMAGRAWLCQRIADSGLELHQDGAANIGARLNWDGKTPSVMAGSHIDTVPGAGHLDGALGVVCALEALRVLQEQQIALRRPLEAVAFTDEEGRFGGMFGSQAMAGLVTPDYLRHAVDLNGISLIDAMAQQGLDAEEALHAQRAPGSIHAYVELHIEQGPVLDRKGVSIGVVDAITGLFKWEITLTGTANHAGTTPMDMRNDAFQGLAEFSGQIDRILEEYGSPRSTATVGRVELIPGAANVIPGQVIFSLDVRDADEATLKLLAEAFSRALSAIARRRGLKFEFAVLSELAAVRCAPQVVQAIETSVEKAGLSSTHLPSGAAHDAQIIAGIAPAGMIFVPSKEGRSHSAAEWTAWADIEAGANTLLNTLRRLASTS
ncbi:Zn-dependent hydrolase [Methylomonas methanica]|uniref:Amidase, hydantoinase/carbamoylase family n=1 Tax=Methylomonas methanica (strain DSM 25384 / MC09) TaxID=857087 RepID=G0A4J7_METMM|nr:Zn-dependent hydrolase [Methylomonas methanica]AEG01588.1 amidase, hydantoinase/carbamoylase family [Methylomonas methanica MC09]